MMQPVKVGLPGEEIQPRERGERLGSDNAENFLHPTIRLRRQREQKVLGRTGSVYPTEFGRAQRVLPKGSVANVNLALISTQVTQPIC